MITFLSFGNQAFTRSAKRIENEARRSGWFNKVEVYSQSLLEQTEFWQTHGKFCQENSRGFGYWIWKPWLIRKTLAEMSEEDILVYADSGCTINTQCSRASLDKIFQKLQVTLLGIYCHQLNSQEYQYTKPETTWVLGTDNTPQIMATIIYIRKCQASVDLINKWCEWCVKDNYRYVNDSYDPKYSLPENYVDHRHDQSIFSLLIKKSLYVPYIVSDNTWLGSDGIWPPDTPIWATRLHL